MKKIFAIFAVLLIFSLSLYRCSKSTPVEIQNNPSSSKPIEENQSKYEHKEKQPEVKENNTTNSSEEAKKVYLKLGDSGEEVNELQTKLNKFQYNLTVDGKLGTLTDFAVRNFQSKVNITSDGIVGPETYKKLDSTPTQDPYLFKLSDKKNDSPQVSSSTNSYETFINSQICSSNTDYYIYTNLSQHVVCIFKGSNYNWKLINSFTCSVGKSSTPTITGHFTVGIKDTYFVTANGIICKYFTQINGNYLFHSILYDKNNNVVDSRLGVNISHGCVRLDTENAKYIYDNVPSGTTIWVQ